MLNALISIKMIASYHRFTDFLVSRNVVLTLLTPEGDRIADETLSSTNRYFSERKSAFSEQAAFGKCYWLTSNQ